MNTTTKAERALVAFAPDTNPPEGGMHFLHESEDFSDYDRQEHFGSEYKRFEALFEERVIEFIKLMGQPTFRGNPSGVSGLEWALGWQVAIWSTHAPPLYAGVWHPDREAPIYVFLARCGYQEWQGGGS